MLASASSLNLVQLIEALQEQEQRYQEASDAINRTLRDQADQQRAVGSEISRTLNQISGMLAGLVGGVSSQPPRSAPPAARRPGRPPKSASASASAPAASAAPRRRGRRSRFGTTGNESVLAFVREHGNPTSAELTAHWNSEGRGGKVENTLGPLVRAKKLKRSPNPNGRGSRYTIA